MTETKHPHGTIEEADKVTVSLLSTQRQAYVGIRPDMKHKGRIFMTSPTLLSLSTVEAIELAQKLVTTIDLIKGDNNEA